MGALLLLTIAAQGTIPALRQRAWRTARSGMRMSMRMQLCLRWSEAQQGSRKGQRPARKFTGCWQVVTICGYAGGLLSPRQGSTRAATRPAPRCSAPECGLRVRRRPSPTARTFPLADPSRERWGLARCAGDVTGMVAGHALLVPEQPFQGKGLSVLGPALGRGNAPPSGYGTRWVQPPQILKHHSLAGYSMREWSTRADMVYKRFYKVDIR